MKYIQFLKNVHLITLLCTSAYSSQQHLETPQMQPVLQKTNKTRIDIRFCLSVRSFYDACQSAQTPIVEALCKSLLFDALTVKSFIDINIENYMQISQQISNSLSTQNLLNQTIQLSQVLLTDYSQFMAAYEIKNQTDAFSELCDNIDSQNENIYVIACKSTLFDYLQGIFYIDKHEDSHIQAIHKIDDIYSSTIIALDPQYTTLSERSMQTLKLKIQYERSTNSAPKLQSIAKATTQLFSAIDEANKKHPFYYYDQRRK